VPRTKFVKGIPLWISLNVRHVSQNRLNALVQHPFVFALKADDALNSALIPGDRMVGDVHAGLRLVKAVPNIERRLLKSIAKMSFIKSGVIAGPAADAADIRARVGSDPVGPALDKSIDRGVGNGVVTRRLRGVVDQIS
jgi:hypothetical protein